MTTQPHHNSHNRAMVIIDGKEYLKGKYNMTKAMMKKNHFIGIDEVSGKEYVVNTANGFAYVLLK